MNEIKTQFHSSKKRDRKKEYFDPESIFKVKSLSLINPFLLEKKSLTLY